MPMPIAQYQNLVVCLKRSIYADNAILLHLWLFIRVLGFGALDSRLNPPGFIVIDIAEILRG